MQSRRIAESKEPVLPESRAQQVGPTLWRPIRLLYYCEIQQLWWQQGWFWMFLRIVREEVLVVISWESNRQVVLFSKNMKGEQSKLELRFQESHTPHEVHHFRIFAVPTPEDDYNCRIFYKMPWRFELPIHCPKLLTPGQLALILLQWCASTEGKTATGNQTTFFPKMLHNPTFRMRQTASLRYNAVYIQHPIPIIGKPKRLFDFWPCSSVESPEVIEVHNPLR